MAGTNNDTSPVGELLAFFKHSKNFLMNCEKPSGKEFFTITQNCTIGFLLMGALGFIIKLVFLMINNILLS